MNTAIAITAIIAAVVVINIIASAIRDNAKTKHTGSYDTCKRCSRDNGEQP